MRKQGIIRVGLAALLLSSPAGPLAAQGLEWLKANYTKHEYTITMRDGVRLFTAVYTPKDRSRSYPIMLDRTPYSCRPCGADQFRENIGPSPAFPKEGYIIVYQDGGRWMSEGKFEHVRHLPQRASHHGTDPGHMVPSDRRQSAEVPEHLPGQGGGFPAGYPAGLPFEVALFSD